MKVFSGEVISAKMEKTATVVVERVVAHPVYKKRYKTAKKYQVHDPFGVEVGQTVEFVPSKPYSKLKKWKITKVFDGEGNEVRSTNGKEERSNNKSKSKKKAKKGGTKNKK